MAITFYPEKAEELGLLINTERQIRGLQPLYMFPYLNECTMIRAEEVSEFYSHYRPNGDWFAKVVDYEIVKYTDIYENIGGGYETPEEMLEGWLGNAERREVLLNQQVTHMGIGLVYNPNGYANVGWYWCAIFTRDLRAGYEYEGQYLPGVTQASTVKINCNDTETGLNFPDITVNISSYGNILNDLSKIKITQNGTEIAFTVLDDKTTVRFKTGSSPTEITDMPSGEYLVEIYAPKGYYSYDLLHVSDYYYTYFTVANDGTEIPDITLNLRIRKLSVFKTDADTGTALSGAILELSGNSVLDEVEVSQGFTLSDDKKTITFTSGSSPVVFSKIPSGNYTIHEVYAPVGYLTAEDTSIYVSQNDSVEIKNKASNVVFTKLGQNTDGTPSTLSGALFQLKYGGTGSFDNVKSSHEIQISRDEKVISWTSSESDVTISGLPQGSYELTEISAPEGFVANEKITFTINQENKVTNAVNTSGEVIDNNIRIYNKRFIPKTVFQHDYITAYDYKTKQNQFNTHGMGVLTPTECTVTENYNGKWELSITHPFDVDNKYQYIRENNIIKALGQLFTLKTVTYSSGERNEVTGKAEHIFYQQNDWWIFPDSARVVFVPRNSVLNLLDYIDFISTKNIVEGQTYYNFTWDSDMTIPEDYPTRIFSNTDGLSPVSVIMESGGILNITGGELYRDNFYFSIRERMENSNDNAFEIRIGNNLRGIRRNVDITTVCTYFQGYDSYGYWFAVSWTDDSVNSVNMPHSVIRSKKFTYSFDDESMSDEEKARKSAELLSADVMNFFGTNCKPLISYEVDLEDVQNNPDFAEFNNKPDYRVGNIGTVYDERLGTKITLKITKTIKDAITGKTKTVLFGDNRSFVSNGYNSAVVDMKPVVRSQGFPLMDSSGAFLYDSEGNALVEEITYDERR